MIDPREIKCSCNSEKCNCSGLSFDENYMFFHYKNELQGRFISKAMILDVENIEEIIKQLKSIKKSIKNVAKSNNKHLR